jgi:Alanyl-tRNA synthetase
MSAIKVRKIVGRFPETVKICGELVVFSENGVASVSEKVAEFLKEHLSHEYLFANEDGTFPAPEEAASAAEAPKVVSDEERDLRGELARARAANADLTAELQKAQEKIKALEAEVAELKKAAEAAEASSTSPAAPAAPTRRTPAKPAAPKKEG